MPHPNIQDGYLFQSLKEDRSLDVEMITGAVLKNVKIKRFDRYTILLEAGPRDVLLYKHAITEIADVEGSPPRSSGRPPHSSGRPPHSSGRPPRR